MREIKFREAIFAEPDNKFVGFNYWGWIDGEWVEPESTDPEASKQYTGLKDKNGKEIYEGDIVTTGEGYGGFPSYNQEEPRLIEFRNGCWCFDAGRYDDGDWIRFGFWTASNEGRNQLKQMEVIGNIYENPELLGGINVKSKRGS